MFPEAKKELPDSDDLSAKPRSVESPDVINVDFSDDGFACIHAPAASVYAGRVWLADLMAQLDVRDSAQYHPFIDLQKGIQPSPFPWFPTDANRKLL